MRLHREKLFGRHARVYSRHLLRAIEPPTRCLACTCGLFGMQPCDTAPCMFAQKKRDTMEVAILHESQGRAGQPCPSPYIHVTAPHDRRTLRTARCVAARALPRAWPTAGMEYVNVVCSLRNAHQPSVNETARLCHPCRELTMSSCVLSTSVRVRRSSWRPPCTATNAA